MSAPPIRDWYLQDWMAAKGKIQADLTKELGWHKNTAYRIWHGAQPWRREDVDQVARWLEIEPYELLLPPSEAIKIRRLRELLVQAADGSIELPAPPPPGERRHG